jgi:hypothetical protein
MEHQLTKDDLRELPALSRCHVRLIHWNGVLIPSEKFDSEALVEVQRNGKVIEFIALLDQSWAVYGERHIDQEGNLFYPLGGQTMAQMQIFTPLGHGSQYTPDFPYYEVYSYTQAIEREQVYSYHTSVADEILTIKPSRLPTGIRVVNATPDPIHFTLDGTKITQIRSCGYILHACARRQLVESRGKVHPTYIMTKQYRATQQGWAWIYAMQKQYGFSLLFLGSELAARAYARPEENAVICPIPYNGESVHAEPLARMDVFEVFPYSEHGYHFTV